MPSENSAGHTNTPSILPYFRGKVNIKVFDVILYRIVIASQHKLLYHVYRRKYVIR